MRTRSLCLVAVVVAFVLGSSSSARAAHHLWRLQQLFSNASGTIQYVELETASGGSTGETGVSGFTVVSGGNTVTFPANLTGTTTDWLLLATSNFASLPGGVTPDLVIPANFLSTGGGTISYAATVSSWTYGALPIDGKTALFRDPNTSVVTTAVNAPVNFANVSGQVNLAPAAAPALPRWAIVLAIGALLLAGSGLIRRHRSPVTTA